ncbi:MAG: hypothetical protein OXR67_01015 [Chloroflexota bacterium]|nr:hypothetical protein [Chloroflexota bacterium]
MFNSLFNRLPASHFGMPDRPTRQWILEHSELAGRIMVKTPGEIMVPIPDSRAGELFTHALYVTGCYHEEECACPDDDAVTWQFVEFLNSNETIQTPGVLPDGLPILNRLLRKDK